MNAPVIISIISLGLCVFFFFFFRRYIARKTAASSLLSDYREEVYRMIAEIDAATDRDSLLVEERIKTLKKIIDDTDRRISVYMREIQRSREGEAMYSNLGKGIRAALDSRLPAMVTSPEPPAETPAGIPAETASVQSDAAKDKSPPAGNTRQAKKRRGGNSQPAQAENEKPKIKERIAQMSARGNSPSEIASNLNLSLAEVELALNLLNRSTGRKESTTSP